MKLWVVKSAFNRPRFVVAARSLDAAGIYMSREEGAEGRDTDDPGIDVVEADLSKGLAETLARGVPGLAHFGLKGWDVEG